MAPSVEVSRDSGWAVVRVTGEMDIYGAPRLREQLIDLVNEGEQRIIVDLDQVGFIDSTGLGVLIGALKRVRNNGGDMRVVATTDPVVRTMRITGLHRVFVPYPSVGDAVAAADIADATC